MAHALVEDDEDIVTLNNLVKLLQKVLQEGIVAERLWVWEIGGGHYKDRAGDPVHS